MPPLPSPLWDLIKGPRGGGVGAAQQLGRRVARGRTGGAAQSPPWALIKGLGGVGGGRVIVFAPQRQSAAMSHQRLATPTKAHVRTPIMRTYDPNMIVKIKSNGGNGGTGGGGNGTLNGTSDPCI